MSVRLLAVARDSNMNNRASYRILVFDDHPEILSLLKVVFDSRGYEVLTYPHPGVCPIFKNENCKLINQHCASSTAHEL